jgi:hypothetical protein
MTALPLDTWRETLGYMPWHFWQMATNSIAGLKVTSECNGLVYEYAWQSKDAVGRSEIVEAIDDARDKMFNHLNYRVGPEYVTKNFQYPRPVDGRMEFSYAADARGRWLSVNVREGYIQAIGTEAREDLGNQAVTYSDQYGGGLNDTFTVTATVTAGTDPDQIAIYFAAADRLDSEALSEKWRIEPVKVTISGTTATIRGRAWLLVRPVLYQGWSATQIDPTVSGNFVTTVDVRRRYTEPDGITVSTAQATLIWETDPPYYCCPCITCVNAPNFDPHDQDPAAEAMAIARAVIRDARTGEIAVGQSVYDSTNDRFVAINWNTCKPPDRVIIRYLAGAEVDEINSQIPAGGSWERALTALAVAELAPARISACDIANQRLYGWQFDRSRAAGANSEQYRISDADLANPFGTRAGAIYAWHQVKNLALVRGRVIG